MQGIKNQNDGATRWSKIFQIDFAVQTIPACDGRTDTARQQRLRYAERRACKIVWSSSISDGVSSEHDHDNSISFVMYNTK